MVDPAQADTFRSVDVTATQQSPDTKTDKPPELPKGPSVKATVGGSAATIAAFAVVAGFAIGGPFGLVVAAGVTGAGTIGGAVMVARLKNPRARKTRPGLLHALIGRPRRAARTGAGLTGASVTRRGRSKTSMSRSGPVGKGGLRLPKMPTLPALTAKGRAKRAAAAAAEPHRRPSKGSAPRAAANRPGTKPAGLKAPGTGSRTPARPGAARKLATAPGRTRAPQAGAAGPVRPRLGTARRTTPGGATSGRSGVRRTGTRAGIRLPATGSKSKVRPGGTSRPVARSGRPSSTGRLGIPTARHRKNPVTSSGTLNRAVKGPKAATGVARRLGSMRTPVRRVDHRRALKAAPPNRTRTRPIPYKTAKVGKLMHTAMRLPKRDGLRFSRPTPVQQRKARRTLVLRSKLAGRRTALKAAKSPVTAAKAAWLYRPLWAYPGIPAVPDPAWREPTIPEPKAKAAPGPKTTIPDVPKTRRHRTEYPQKTARRAPTNERSTTMSSSPVQAAAEAAAMIGGYTAQGATEYLAFLNQQPEIMKAFGQAYRLHAQRMVSEMPFSASAANKMADLGAAMMAVESLAAELGPALRAGNPEQFAALENRTPGQAMFDTTNN